MKAPSFYYRPLPIDPDLIKRKLYNLRVEDISDPTISYLFRDKRRELDLMLDMISERGKPDFTHGSLQLYGPVDTSLLEVAKALLVVVKPEEERDDDYIDATEFAKMAEEELQYLQQQYPEVSSAVRVRDDVSGVMVTRGILNVSKQYKLSARRAKALVQHEVGTHVATYYNGKAQPFRLFSQGVPGYEQLQEGVAVFSEYLMGGLTRERMRIIAARVVATAWMLDGRKFSDTFFELFEQYGFQAETAYHITMRIYRGGGLTKDAVYLKGLLNLITYIQSGKDLQPLLVGKVREDYLPVISELTKRGVLIDPPITPRFMQPPYIEKMEAIRSGGSVFNMIF